MQLTSLQQKKVDEIIKHFQNNVKKVDFKAPTGSGKTLMATNVISEIINKNDDKKFIFIIATISSSELPLQFERKINEYKNDLNYSNFEVEYIESPSSNKSNKSDAQPQIKLIQNKVYIFGKATFGKGRIFTENGIIEDFINECKQLDYKIIYIRDEAHIGGEKINKKDVENFEQLMDRNSDFILRMTATFKDSQNAKRVELKERELTDENYNDGKWLIKTDPRHLSGSDLSDEELLEKAITQFKKIKEEYKTLETNGIFIRPAMLIQIDSEPTDTEKKKLFFDTLDLIKKKLNEANLSWVKYFGNNNKESSNVDNEHFKLDKISRNNDPTDCIIFKIGPATGWDIPRACMLLQLRNVCSESLKIQTIGRIKRNPYPNLKKNEITDKYYLYSNEKKTNSDEYLVYTYKVKDNFENETFISIKIVQDENNRKIIEKNLENNIKEFLQENKNYINQKINECFTDKESKIGIGIDDNGNTIYKEYKYTIFKNNEQKIIIDTSILLLKLLKRYTNNLNTNQKTAFSIIEKEYKNYDNLKDKKIESIKIILISFFMKEINNIIQKSLSQNIKYKLVETPLKPNIYTKIYENKKIIEERIDKNYLFNIKKNNEEYKKQILDSDNEKIVFDKILDYTQDSGSIKVLAKNPNTGNIYGEYFDENNCQRKSYFDFILKFKNGNILYIEVKGEQDINNEKTKLLQKAYKSYFEEDIQYELFKKHIFICIVKVSLEKDIKLNTHYNKNLIKDKLENYNFEELLKHINEL